MRSTYVNRYNSENHCGQHNYVHRSRQSRRIVSILADFAVFKYLRQTLRIAKVFGPARNIGAAFDLVGLKWLSLWVAGWAHEIRE